METLEVAAASKLRVQVEAGKSSARFVGELVRVWLTHALELPADGAETVRVRLALVEALTNVVRHAYAGRAVGSMTLSLETEGDVLVATIEDDGREFDPQDGDVELPSPSDLRESGYGLGIIHAVMDGVEYEHSEDRGNRLILRKKLWT